MFKVYTTLLNWGWKTPVKPALKFNRILFLNNSKFVNIRQVSMRYSTNENNNKCEDVTKCVPPKDEISTFKEEIYVGPLSKRLQMLKITTSTTSLVGLLILKDLHSRFEFPNQAVMISTLGTLLLFNFLTPFLINLFSKKYCVKIFYDHSKKEYTAEFYTYLFKKTSITFTPDDVVLPSVHKFFTVAYVKGYPLFFDVNNFKDVEFYKNIMGYDKPIDLKLDENVDTSKNQE